MNTTQDPRPKTQDPRPKTQRKARAKKQWKVLKDGQPCAYLQPGAFNYANGLLGLATEPTVFVGSKGKRQAARAIAQSQRKAILLRGSLVDEHRDIKAIIAPGEMTIVPA